VVHRQDIPSVGDLGQPWMCRRATSPNGTPGPAADPRSWRWTCWSATGRNMTDAPASASRPALRRPYG